MELATFSTDSILDISEHPIPLDEIDVRENQTIISNEYETTQPVVTEEPLHSNTRIALEHLDNPISILSDTVEVLHEGVGLAFQSTSAGAIPEGKPAAIVSVDIPKTGSRRSIISHLVEVLFAWLLLQLPLLVAFLFMQAAFMFHCITHAVTCSCAFWAVSFELLHDEDAIWRSTALSSWFSMDQQSILSDAKLLPFYQKIKRICPRMPCQFMQEAAYWAPLFHFSILLFMIAVEYMS